ncbi:MAG TPA: protein kinase [Vicinamibacterales bacterium]|nr:protein kinase [Vicinamibacterales bacterium]
MPLSLGTRLGPYEVIAAIGAGGMGEVYRARDTRLGRDVAIKVLPADLASDPERLARFEREAKAVSALNHPHIVTLYEVGSSDAGPYLVLEKIEGRSLRELLDAGPMSVRRILTLAAQIAEGVAKAHSAGIVHRDLKPGNIMVTDDGFAKVLDFGLAKLVWPESGAGTIEDATTLVNGTSLGLVLGTPGYLSPEQASGKPADYRADQFALGALMYEMATSERPFKRPTLLESLTATIREEPEPVRSKRPDLPAPFEWLIDRCLAKDPGDRYASTLDLARELASLRDHLSDLSRMPAPHAGDIRTRGWPRRLMWSALAVAGAAVVAVGSFVVARRTADTSLPSFRPITFQRGVITGARFGPDGRTVYYSAAYGAGPSRIFVTHLEQIESKQLDLPPGFLMAVSARNELALLLTNERAAFAVPGTVARVPAIGGTPRHLVEGATYADWASDGERMAISRADGQCEFPVGRRIAPACAMVRVSPKADHIAFLTAGRLEIQDFGGKRLATDALPHTFGLAWSPDGREVWFTGSETGSAHDRALYALSLGGRRRLIARGPGSMSVYDVAPDGKSALIVTGAGWFGINAGRAGESREQTLDLLGRTEVVGLSADGQWLLVNETREVGAGTYLRSTDGTRTVHLGGDTARGLSPDGGWALVQARGSLTHLTLVPTAAGVRRDVPLNPGLESPPFEPARWSRDGRRLFLPLRSSGRGPRSTRLYARENDAEWRAVTPEGITGSFVVSPDGQLIAANDDTGSVPLFGVDGRAPRRLEGEKGQPVHWSADGRHLFLSAPERFPARIYRRELASGRVEPWRTIAPADPTGVMFIWRVLLAGDDRSYVYQYSRGLNDLYLARDLR